MPGSNSYRLIHTLLALWMLLGATGCGDKNKKKTKTAADETAGDTTDPGEDTAGEDGAYDWSHSASGDTAEETGDGGGEEDMSIPDAPPEDVDDETRMLGQQYLSEGLMAASSGNKEKAKTSFSKSLSADPNSYQAAYNLGALAEQEGDLGQAKSFYKKAIASNPQYGPAIKAYAYLVARSGSMKSALDFTQEKHNKFPENPEVATAYAELLVMSGKNEKAIDVATLALKQDESNVPAMIALARAYLANDQHEFAGFILDMAEKNDPSEPVIYYIRGLIYEKSEYDFAAMEKYEEAIKLKPDFVEALNRLAVLQVNGGSFEDAAKNLEKVVSLVPDSAVAHLNLGEAYRGIRQWQKSHEHLVKAEKLGADQVAVTLNLAFLYFAADSLPGMNRIKILEEARTRFLKYRDLVGAKAASQTVDIDLTLKQIDKMIKIQEKLAKKKAAAEAAAAGGGDGGDEFDEGGG